jgi:hypothetical protein
MAVMEETRPAGPILLLGIVIAILASTIRALALAYTSHCH